MKGILRSLATVLCLPTAASSAAAKTRKPNPRSIALFEKAIQISNLKAKDGVAFRLQATFQIDNGKKTIPGKLVEFWTPGGKWLEETYLHGYTLTTGSDGKTEWMKDSTEYEPFPAAFPWMMMNFVRDLRSAIKAASSAVPDRSAKRKSDKEGVIIGNPREEKGGRILCADVSKSGTSARTVRYCFESATGILISAFHQQEGLSYEYSDYQTSGAHSFPRSIRASLVNGKKVAELRITQLDPMGTVPLGTFAPPPGSKTLAAEVPPGCKLAAGGMAWQFDPWPLPKLIKVVNPVYPYEAAVNHVEGTVLIYGVIGTDGSLHPLWQIDTPSESLSVASVQALRQWRYQPVMVCGQAVPVPTILAVVFSLGS